MSLCWPFVHICTAWWSQHNRATALVLVLIVVCDLNNKWWQETRVESRVQSIVSHFGLTCSKSGVWCRDPLDYHISSLRALTHLWFWAALWAMVKYSLVLLGEFCITFADSDAAQQFLNKAGLLACSIWKKELCARIINLIQRTNGDLLQFLGCRKALVFFSFFMYY